MLAHDQMPLEAQAVSESLTDVTEHKTSQEFVRNIQVSAALCTRSTILILMLLVGLAYQSALRARADQNENTAKIMTQNVDAGTDFGYFAGVSSLQAFLQGVELTYDEITLGSNIALRAAQLASEIASNRPALVGLQEVTLWRTGPLHVSSTPPSPSAPTILYDQLDLLLNALPNQYMAIAVQTLTDVEVPDLNLSKDVRFTDRNVVLVRTDLMGQLALSNIQMQQFKAHGGLPIPGGSVPILRGWISVDAHVQGNLLRFVTTHLETDADPVTQLKQANELVQALNSQDNPPVVLCGDFNADADTPNPTIAAIRTGGFTDVWPTLHPLDPGYTVPLYIEDLPSPPPYTAVSTPSHRIDLVFVRDLRATQITLVGNQVSPPWPSDHAGVVASVPIDQ
jgi:endonuclease/exonuclease/phosphatase family metal-dependent hydrolase